MTIDSQVHAYAPNTPECPWHKEGKPNPEHVTGDELVAAMDRVQVDGAILVSAALYGYDPGYAVEVQKAHPRRVALVKRINPDIPDIEEHIEEWKRTPGTVGVRVLMAGKSDPNAKGIPRILKTAARLNLVVNLQVGGKIEEGAKLIDAHPETKFAIDHLGFYQPRVKPAPADTWDALPGVLDLARRPNAALKISGAITMSQKGPPFDDLWEPLARIFDAWGIERCLWGTDWTRVHKLYTYEQAVQAFRTGGRLSEGERALLMGGACARVYGWSPSP